MSLKELLKRPVITVFPDEGVMQAARLMREKKVGAVVVVEEHRPIGILTDRDIVIRVMTESKELATTTVRTTMTPRPITVPEGTGVWELIQTMKTHGIRRCPVVSEEGILVGIMTMDDLIGLLGNEMAALGSAIAFELGHEKLVAA